MGSPRWVRILAGRCEWVDLVARPGGGGLAERCPAAAVDRPDDGPWYCGACRARANGLDRVRANPHGKAKGAA